MRELRYAVRSLLKAPMFTAVAVLTLALGIGANTAIFSLLDATLLKPLPYPEPDRLVKVWGRFTGIGLPDDRNWVSAPEFRDLQGTQRAFSGIAVIDTGNFNVTVGSRPERLQGAAVSPAFFGVLGVRAARGRVFTEDEAQAGRNNVVILSDTVWRRSFGGDPSVVGRVVRVNGTPMEVVGVMAEGFSYPPDSEIWTARAFAPQELDPNNRGNHGLEVVARVKPGLSLDQARADVEAAADVMIAANPNYNYKRANFTWVLVPLVEETVGDIRTALYLLMGAVAFVLLIACANVANLQFVRSSARARELAVREALGASRRNLIAPLLAESTLLAVTGAVVGLLAARWTLAVIVPLAVHAFPRVASASLDGSVLAFTAVVAVATVLLFGVAPALHGTGSKVSDALKASTRTTGASPASRRVRRFLVAGEVALALVLLAGAGLLGRSLVRLLQVDPGFRPDGVLTFRVVLPASKYANKPEDIRTFYRDLLDRTRRIPGVSSAGSIAFLPLSGNGASGTTTPDVPAPPDAADGGSLEADWRPVMPGYFETMGVRLVSGRFFSDADNEKAAPVAIVDETMARTFWPNGDAIGKRIRRGGRSPMNTNPWMTIVGVVGHVRYRTLEATSRTELYWPEVQAPFESQAVVLRTEMDPSALKTAVEREVMALDPDQPVFAVKTMNEIMAESTARRRLATVLIAVFAGLALLLAMVGVYGLTAYAVAERSSELGIRMALGADPARLVGSIVSQSAVLAAAGVLVGLFVAMMLGRVAASQLFDVTPNDPASFGVAAVLLFGTGLLASYIPARRAARIDPARTLRAE